MGTRAAANEPRTSRIGKRPVGLPRGVQVAVADGRVQVKGPKGTLSRALPERVAIQVDGALVRVSSPAPGREAARLQGLVRALVANMVKGVTEGYERRLELHGAGYRAEVSPSGVRLNLGFSHPVDFSLPDGVSLSIPADSKGTRLVLQGADKEVIGQTAATIRGFRPPQPYGGKGIRYAGERVREKAGKAGK
ncbi:MAG: 50S ribosomal protein L6 [Deltaproteobacteria bacterium]|nr:50S ribosomal protein L6 [Deltaproteobacteria bacterium]